MKAEERRELILEAATGVFGNFGYHGATTDQVAKAAGVSQPYVVRMFGTKEKLFLCVLSRALELMLLAFRAALAEPDEVDLTRRLGRAYVGLLSDRGLLLSLMHGFVLGNDPEIGTHARHGFLQVYEFLRTEAGMSTLQAHDFLASGMLANTLLAVRMSDVFDTDTSASELMLSAFPEKLDLLLDIAHEHRPAQ
jgi:TetR/AcrR family transcriptional regulator